MPRTFQTVTDPSRTLCRFMHGVWMFITEEEAAAIYAGACRSWYGINAQSVIHSQIKKLMVKGDRKGS
jgi:hypothetical protein